MSKTVFITGASSGFGRLTAKTFHQKGWNVVATMRAPDAETVLTQLDNVLVSKLDVTDKASIETAVSAGLARFGAIDVLVNNAGHSLQGVVQTTTDSQMRRQFDVNFFGIVDVINAVVPHFLEKKAGVIVNVSSIAGRVAFPFTAFYHASKFAVEGFTESLQYELNPMGIRLKLIEPGAFPTRIMESGEWSETGDDSIYSSSLEAAKASMNAMASEEEQDPQQVADQIYLAATDDAETLRYPVGADAEQILSARAEMNDVEFKNMIRESTGV
ncbi:SDR family oxidoreductase [Labrenzia sp. PHM005]|uniref:SDR family oxidoreductase n=1 Tax=Labrenzia sp. PHM005 TaxID=2590016 RepID=UPI00114019C9|nr:SDR family oxidoreductase [Labrenzia sp. PHM005]QDG78311.1 SDR family oxidoreductase [Labrenzia sp. PHM005]